MKKEEEERRITNSKFQPNCSLTFLVLMYFQTYFAYFHLLQACWQPSYLAVDYSFNASRLKLKLFQFSKKGERELCSNYRPISILNPFAKLFEKCLLDQLNNHFVSNNLISPNQYGFKKNCSTNEAVLDIYNKLLDNMDKKLITWSIFLDLKKAYDTINHSILIKKLEKYGIRGLPLQLLASYLTDHQQYIVNQYKSKSRDVICGIPQGSTLGPLLFNIYINDLPLASNSTIHLFADDTNLTLFHFNVSTLQ